MNGHCQNQRQSRGQLGILSCRAGEPFSKLLLAALKQRYKEEGCVNGGPIMLEAEELHFGNTELKTEIMQSVRGMDLYVVQDVENKEYDKAQFRDHIPLHRIDLPFPIPEGVDPNMLVEVQRPYSVDENLRALLTAIDSAKRADAHYVSAVLPTFPYGRQDKAISRECITASRIAQNIEAHKADRVLTLDIHNSAIAGFFRDIPCETLHSSKVIMAYIGEHLDLENLVVVSPDEGGIARANYFAKRLGRKLAMGYKRRDYTKASVVEEFRILGDVVRRHRTLEDQISAIDDVLKDGVPGISPSDALQKIYEILEIKAEGLDVLYIDDMIATAGSLVKGVLKVHELGAKSVWFACALPLFTHPALERIDDLYSRGLLQGVIGTNAVFHHSEEFKKAHPWYHEVPVERYFADAMYNINHYFSISELLK